MKYPILFVVMFCSLSIPANAQIGIYQHGSVVRMRMSDCLIVHHGFMVAIGGQAAQAVDDQCPEYTLLSDKVVFVIVGKSSNQLVPLAEIIDFRFHNNELAVRVDDARKEAKFSIKEMILRSQWELMQRRLEEQVNMPPKEKMEGVVAMGNRE